MINRFYFSQTVKGLGLIVLCVIALHSNIYAQPDSVWTRLFNGTHNDYGYSVQQTTDGGFVLCGSKQAFLSGPSDIWVIKTNANGDTIWTSTVGGGNTEEGFTIRQTADGGYIIAGMISTGNNKPILVKLDSNGDFQWQQVYAQDVFFTTWAHDMTVSSQGGYVLTGRRGVDPDGNEDFFLLKVDGVGDTLWNKIYGGPDNDRANSIIETMDGGYVVTGYTGERFQSSWPDVWLLRTDSNGDTLWSRKYGDSDAQVAKCVRQTSDGGFIITGYDGVFGEFSISDILLIKTDANGDTVWTRTFYASMAGKGYAVRETSDHGFVVCGTVNNFPNMLDVVVFKTDVNGNLLWEITFSSPNEDRAYDIEQIDDNGFILTGMWGFRQNVSFSDAFLMRLEPDVPTGIGQSPTVDVSGFELFNNYPNPFNPATILRFQIPQRNLSDRGLTTLTVYDVLGKEIKTLVNEAFAPGSYEVRWDGTDNAGQAVSSGVYLYQLRVGNAYVQTRKMVLMR